MKRMAILCKEIQPYVFRPLLQMDLTKLSLEERERKLEQWIQTEVESPFDLEQGPLFRGKLIRISEEEWILLCNMHHIISDGWSMEILLQEWMAFYENAIGENKQSWNHYQFNMPILLSGKETG